MRIRINAIPNEPLDVDALVAALLELARERRRTTEPRTRPCSEDDGARPQTENSDD